MCVCVCQDVFGVALQMFDDLWKIADPPRECDSDATASLALFSNCMIGTRILLNELLKMVSLVTTLSLQLSGTLVYCSLLCHSLTYSLTYSLTRSLTHLLTYSLTHLLTYSLTHSLTLCL